MESFIITNVTVYTEEDFYKQGFVKVEDGIITKTGHNDELTEEIINGAKIITLTPDLALIPGMIDIHIHGVDGVDTMDATPEALHTMAKALPREGTTSFLATTITQSEEEIEKALQNVANYMGMSKKADVAEVVGIHLEGPFISKKRAGAQPNRYIKAPDLTLFMKWQELSGGNIKVVTLAPEEENGLEFIHHLSQTGVVASIGHSNATYEEVDHAINAGASHVTHLFNGMSGLHHREPGVVGAALLREELKVEMIVDGIHIRPEIVKHTYRSKTSESILLITDSMRAKCLKAGQYELGGQKVIVTRDRATLEDGTLAGSILKMGTALQNFQKYTGCRLEELVKITSMNPAKSLNIFDRKGSITEGKDADFVILDSNLNIMMTYCRGHLVYKRGEMDECNSCEE
ncbi:N-acetylglucosamine-6-phosphate deacetylase [Bacillus sp. CGMCC 1.16607]|uniref:N-acetylglucosamine-6-phosphate deacetylase n=1 Tax=Bacillus sp. CGMCC 1.16607 TaxID=3351842 RepID=UPI0036377A4D